MADVKHGIPDDVERFVAERLQTIEELELLLWLSRGDGSSWTIARLAHDARLEQATVAAALDELIARGLVEVDDRAIETYRLAIADEGRRELLVALADTYRRSRTELILILAKGALERVRDNARVVFSTAFLGRKKGSDG